MPLRIPAVIVALSLSLPVLAQNAPAVLPSPATQSPDNPEHPGSLNTGVTSNGIAVTIATLPDRGTVTLKGVVQEVGGQEDFIIADESGSIDVDGAEQISLRRGDLVTVSGKIANENGRSYIDGARVTINGNGPIARVK